MDWERPRLSPLLVATSIAVRLCRRPVRRSPPALKLRAKSWAANANDAALHSDANSSFDLLVRPRSPPLSCSAMVDSYGSDSVQRGQRGARGQEDLKHDLPGWMSLASCRCRQVCAYV